MKQDDVVTWESLGITEDDWLGFIIQKLAEQGMPLITAAHVVTENESAALSAYHNGKSLMESVRRIKELVK